MKSGAKKGRPKAEIKPIQSIRLKTIMDEQGLTQTQLSKMIPISQQSLSKVMTRNGNLSEETAKRISSLFPEYGYRYEWIMGYDDMPTIEYAHSFKNAMLLKDRLTNESYNRGKIRIIKEIIDNERIHGKSDISIEEPWTYVKMHDEGLISDDEFDEWTHSGKPSDNMKALAAEHSDYVLTIDGESIKTPIIDFFLIGDDFYQYSFFRLREYVKNKKRGYY